LYHSLNPLFCDVFAAFVVCIRSLPSWAMKSHRVDVPVFCLLLYLWFKPRSHWKIPSEQRCELSLSNLVLSTGKFHSIRPRKFPEIHTGNFGRVESAPQISSQLFHAHVQLFVEQWKYKTSTWRVVELRQWRRCPRGQRLVKNKFIFYLRIS